MIRIAERFLIVSTVVVVSYFVLCSLGEYKDKGRPQQIRLDGTIFNYINNK